MQSIKAKFGEGENKIEVSSWEHRVICLPTLKNFSRDAKDEVKEYYEKKIKTTN